MWWRVFLYVLATLLKWAGADWPASGIFGILRRHRPDDPGLHGFFLTAELQIFGKTVPDVREYSRTLQEFAAHRIDQDLDRDALDKSRRIGAELMTVKEIGKFIEERDIDWPPQVRRWLEMIAADVGVSKIPLPEQDEDITAEHLTAFVDAVETRLDGQSEG